VVRPALGRGHRELQRNDIAAGAEVIRVSRAVVHREGCRVDTPKSHKGRTVVVPPHIRAAVKHHPIDTHTASGPEALLFAADRSCHLSDKTFRRYFATALAAVGCNGVRIHDLRHFAGTQVALVGNLRETMDWLGAQHPERQLALPTHGFRP
jgi:integrase